MRRISDGPDAGATTLRHLAADAAPACGSCGLLRGNGSEAMGQGLHRQRLRKAELPIELPIIMAGVRMAVVINVGVAAIAAYIGAGGLGKLISRGISQSDPRQLIAGAILVSLLAIAADFGLGWVQRFLTPKGLRSPSRTASFALRLGVLTGIRKQPRQAH